MKKILISAYACEPSRGSESAVGWNWAFQMARFYEVVVITRKSRQEPIEEFFKSNPNLSNNLRFEYVDFPNWVLKFKKGGVIMNFYYIAWQFLAFLAARRLIKKDHFSLVHHVSFMSLTRGSFVPFLGIPSIVGPVGGLQTVPDGCREVIKSKWVEKIRTFGIRCFRFNPLGRLAIEKANRLVLANASNSDLLPPEIFSKTTIGLQIGTDIFGPRVLESGKSHFTFRWIGRMIDHKGFAILIDVLSKIRDEYPEKYSKIQILVSGSGPLKQEYLSQIIKCELESSFVFLGWLSVEEMDEQWNTTDVFLFTSLRETTGLALLEAMVKEVPPIIISNGGPAEIVTDQCGYRIKVGDYENLVEDYASTMIQCMENPDDLVKMGRMARERVLDHYTWDAVGDRMHSIYEELLSSSNRAG